MSEGYYTVTSWSHRTILVDDGYGSNVTYHVVWISWGEEKEKTIYIYQRNYSVRVLKMSPVALSYKQLQNHLAKPQVGKLVEQTTRALLWLLIECQELAEYNSGSPHDTLILGLKPIMNYLFQRASSLNDQDLDGHWTDSLDNESRHSTGFIAILCSISQDPRHYNMDRGTTCDYVELWRREGEPSIEFFLFICRNKSQALVILPDKQAVNLWLEPYGRVGLADFNSWLSEYNPNWNPPGDNNMLSNFLFFRSFGLVNPRPPQIQDMAKLFKFEFVKTFGL